MLPPCVSLPCLPPQPVPHSSLWRYRVGFSAPQLPLEMESWSHGKFWSPADDRQLPRLLSITMAYFSSTFLGSQLFSSSHLFLDLTDPLPPSFLSFPIFPHSTPSCHRPVRTSFCLPLQTPLKHPLTLPTINVKIRPRAPNPPAECVILTQALQEHTVLKWHLVAYRLRGQSLRKTHIDDSHHNNEKNSRDVNWLSYSCSKSSVPLVKKKKTSFVSRPVILDIVLWIMNERCWWEVQLRSATVAAFEFI